jgi:hypothetical protein
MIFLSYLLSPAWLNISFSFFASAVAFFLEGEINFWCVRKKNTICWRNQNVKRNKRKEFFSCSFICLEISLIRGQMGTFWVLSVVSWCVNWWCLSFEPIKNEGKDDDDEVTNENLSVPLSDIFCALIIKLLCRTNTK